MDINLTLLGQMITFAIFVFVTMKYVWPPIMQGLADRQAKIADGLAAAERGQHDLELAQHKAAEQLKLAKADAAEIIDQANKRAARLVEEGKDNARTEGNRILDAAKADIEQAALSSRAALLKEFSQIALDGVEKILQEKVDPATHRRFVDQLIAEIPGA